MGAEHEHPLTTLLTLFDSFWFEYEILTSKNPATTLSSKTQEDTVNPNNELSRAPTTFISGPFSDKCLSSENPSMDAEEPSPESVLLEPRPQLQPILSGKEFSDQTSIANSSSGDDVSFRSIKSSRRRMRRKDSVKRNSKSLSDLEFKEVKGFMDLGFVFSDEDRDSDLLVSIIPGLQKRGVSEYGGMIAADVSRPYLSEAWDAMEEQKRDNDNNSSSQSQIGSWRIPSAFGNEMEMKNHLKFWAHAVASNVI
ncbi:unnamed protein product [Cuscuta epithymum]|uniref:Uncharacterized protein n=1 Tax=Cuscuta epithymum TaxID=186058 RepID=A0AAV0FIV1_9ASTE|nr:unnamed protein product [Cuscuta epithymum]